MKHEIPFFSLKRQWQLLEKKVNEAVFNVLKSTYYIGGAVVKTFEKTLGSYLGIKHVIACNSGTDALWLALRALETPKKSIVLTTPFSFIASSSEIVAHGAHPVFIDVEKTTYNIDPTLLLQWLEEHASITKAGTIHTKTQLPIVGILAVDLFGQCADYKKLRPIAEKWGLWIIEDAAQSIGSSIDSQKAGTFGNIGCFSFYPTKNLGACGDAGAVVTNDPRLAQKLRCLRNHGRLKAYDYMEYGINSRLDVLQAAILREKLTYLDHYNQQRQNLAARYHQHLSSQKNLTLPKETTGVHIFHQYAVVVEETISCNLRDQLRADLAQHLIGTSIFYPASFSTIPFLLTNPALATACPVAEALSQTILALPIWPELTYEEIEYVCACLNEGITMLANKTAKQTKKDHQKLTESPLSL